LRVADQARLIGLGEALTAAVREAGAIAKGMAGATLKSWTKGHDSPVSEADIAVDHFLRDRLDAILPECGWLSEESHDDQTRLTRPLLWIVDPIDGTRAYVAGKPDWSISAALVQEGRPIAACIFAPVEDSLFTAVAGGGTCLNGARITAAPGTDLAGARAAGPKSYLESLVRLAPEVVSEPKVHSLALRLARVASRQLDLAFASTNANDWDLAAADLLVHEAGGALTTIDGRVLAYNRTVPRHSALVAAGRERHAALVELMRSEKHAFA
jgi:myo-inositol-1(or 4)-monophosphatase